MENEFRGLELVANPPEYLITPYGVMYFPLVAPPNQITVRPGETVRFNVRFEHRGPGGTYYLYCSLGVVIGGVFNEDAAITRRITKTITESADWRVVTETGDIPIPAGYTAFGWKDAYAKIQVDTADKTISPIYDDPVQIIALVPEFQNIAITQFVKV